ncbi:MAG: ATPase [Solirubrobacteraceae bacterium]|nr:ATPase [Solirubrobacteraceae bacterium]
MARRTLGDHLSVADADRFVGRVPELERLDDLLGPEPERRVVFVHGPGGIGKSTLLRAMGRHAAELDFEVVLLDGRDLDPVPGALEEALEPAFAAERPLLLLDTWERMASAGTALRSRLLPTLPAAAVVVISSREAPEAGWFTGGWESLVAEIELRPLARDEATTLVHTLGVTGETADRIVAWAGGSPLALTVAAGASQDREGWAPDRPEEDPDVLRSLLRRVIEHELSAADAEVSAVTALARLATPDLLSAVLPGVDGTAAVDRLLELSFAERAGTGVRFHDLARRALRADLRARDPEHDRELRRRIADHLYARVLAGGPRLMVDLTELVDNQALRWGFGAEGSPQLRIDGVRPGTADELAAALVARGERGAVASTIAILDQAPDRVIVARDSADTLCGFSISTSVAGAPAVAEADPLLGPWLEHARAQPDNDRALLWRDTVDLTADSSGNPNSPVLALMNTAAIMRSGVPNPRYLYLPINPANAPAVAFAKGVRAVHVPELDYVVGRFEVQCHIVDSGEAGLVGAVVGSVYAELGLEVPSRPAAAPAPASPVAALDPEDVRDALRSFHRPGELAASPLAAGATPDDRVASVRTRLEQAVANAFGDSDDEQLQRRIVELGYLDSTTTHEAAADALHLSRAAYFRRLRQAVDRVADWVLSHRS